MKTQQKTNTSIGLMNEDWLTVLLGFIFISTVLFIYKIPSPSFGWKTETWAVSLLTSKNISLILVQFGLTMFAGLAPVLLYKRKVNSYLIAFPIVFALALLAQLLAGNNGVKSLNLEAVVFSLLFGLLIGNLIKVPQSIRSTLSAEFFVKIGLVLLGTNVLFSDVLKAGALGLAQSLAVVISVWYFSFWICKKLKIDGELTMMLSSAVSICGVSAAIATAGAIRGDSKKLSYVISLVLITAIPMVILMPYAANYLGLSQAVTGAWLGGTIDTTGAVVAAGSLVGEEALKVSTIVKFSQNVLLGVAAFIISVYWAYSKNPNATERPSLKIIWDRFPKFVLGFIAASLLFSFFIDADLVTKTKDGLKSIQTLLFVLAFTCIGLETKLSELFSKDLKPLYAFLIAQAFNIVFTLVLAFLLFNTH
jgi:uncharacterized integral membrane protein (TIGR00698 family)